MSGPSGRHCCWRVTRFHKWHPTGYPAGNVRIAAYLAVDLPNHSRPFLKRGGRHHARPSNCPAALKTSLQPYSGSFGSRNGWRKLRRRDRFTAALTRWGQPAYTVHAFRYESIAPSGWSGHASTRCLKFVQRRMQRFRRNRAPARLRRSVGRHDDLGRYSVLGKRLSSRASTTSRIFMNSVRSEGLRK